MKVKGEEMEWNLEGKGKSSRGVRCDHAAATGRNEGKGIR